MSNAAEIFAAMGEAIRGEDGRKLRRKFKVRALRRRAAGGRPAKEVASRVLDDQLEENGRGFRDARWTKTMLLLAVLREERSSRRAF